MRSIKIYWAKLVLMSVLLVTLTAVCTLYMTSGYRDPQFQQLMGGLQEREMIIGDRFSQSEPVIEAEMPQPPPNRQATNENDRIIMIRRPKGADLTPKPINWLKNASPSYFGWPEMPASRPPKCILLGFGKCGTSALLEFLDLHPKIVSLDWEPDYFCERMYPKYDLQWYVKRMPPSFSDQITIEKSPCYIVEHDSHLRMHAMNSSLKIMVIIRDPITRLLSEYGHYYATETYWGRPVTSFEDRLFNHKTNELRIPQILKVGDYNPHFEHLLNVFPREQLLIVDGDKLVTDPLSQTRRVEDFLSLPHAITEEHIYFDRIKGFYCMKPPGSQETKCLGKSKGREHVEIKPEFKEKLIEFFRPYNEKFFKLVGQRFDWLS